MTNEKGNAAIMIVFCKAVSPLTDNRITAIVDWMIPQVSLTVFGGVNDPFVDCIPKTKVAESADVMKNEMINTIATIERSSDNGIVLNISKTTSSVDALAKSLMPVLWILIAVDPNAENQNAPITVGPTLLILNTFTDSLGGYLSNLVQMSFRTAPLNEDNRVWLDAWTIFYWSWWIAWAPFVGMFIARVSKGRTIKEFLIGVLVVPTVIGAFWFSAFGIGRMRVTMRPFHTLPIHGNPNGRMFVGVTP